MAATQKKANTTSTRKSGTSSASRSGSGGSRSTASGSRAPSRAKAPEPKPIRREVGGLVCLVLGIFTALGYFHMEGFVIDALCGAMKGLIGYGYWLLPPALLYAAFVLGFHHGRPVRLRVTCILMLPVAFGGFLHLFLARGEFPWTDQ